MAQGAIKKSSSSSGANKPQQQQQQKQKQKTKKGARVAKPRKASAADKLQRRYAAGLTAKTEKLLGERAGPLELIGAGRKGKKGDGEKGGSKGGSRKFG
ncbi:hypothetical protein DL763_003337 [Monosporascus cannonballus]|nr:hypothetical protein DL763_003337 [Monosporascus cannonballus]